MDIDDLKIQNAELNSENETLKKLNKKLKNKTERLEGENSGFVIFFKNLKFKSYRAIHFFITLLFIVLVTITIYKVSTNFYSDFQSKTYYSQETIELIENEINLNDEQQLKLNTIVSEYEEKIKDSEELNEQKELKLLSKIEHIFIYLIPLLLLIGFYFYYHFNYGNYFEGSKPNPKDVSLAKDSLKLTKTLFISSIMSYVIIKIIEKTFFEDKASTQALISYGVLLLLLMSYLILSHIGEHKGGKDK